MYDVSIADPRPAMTMTTRHTLADYGQAKELAIQLCKDNDRKTYVHTSGEVYSSVAWFTACPRTRQTVDRNLPDGPKTLTMDCRF